MSMIRIEQEDNSRALIVGRKEMWMLETIDLSEVRNSRSPIRQVFLRVRSVWRGTRREKIHDGKVYKMLRRWYVPSKNAGMHPPDAEKMLTRTLARLEPGTSRAFSSMHICIH